MEYRRLCYGCGKARDDLFLEYLGKCLFCKIAELLTGRKMNYLGELDVRREAERRG